MDYVVILWNRMEGNGYVVTLWNRMRGNGYVVTLWDRMGELKLYELP